jgi:iron(III) transport system permease protein
VSLPSTVESSPDVDLALEVDEPRRPRRGRAFRIFSWTVSLATALLILYPLARALGNILGLTEGDLRIAELADVWFSSETAVLLLHTLILVTSSSVLALAVGIVFAWLNERTDARMGWIARILPIMSMFVPGIAAAIGWVFLASPDAGFLNQLLRNGLGLFGVQLDSGPINIFSWYGLIFVSTLVMTPYSYMALAGGLRSLDAGLEEAARVSGASVWETFRRVTLPNLKPAIGSAMLLNVTNGFALFAIPIILAPPAHIKIMVVEIVQSVVNVYPADLIKATALALLMTAIVLSSWALQRRVSRQGRFAVVGERGSRATPTPLGTWRLPARLIMLGYLLLTSVLPFGALVLVSLQGFWNPHIALDQLGLDNYTALFENQLVADGLRNSVVFGLVCATVGILVAALVSYVSSTQRSRVGGALDAVVRLPAALTHVLIGIAFLLAFVGAPFYWGGTIQILLLCYIVLHFPHASFYSTQAIQQIGPKLIEAARVSGATEGRTFVRILLPLMAPVLLAGWALLFVVTAAEITASVLLAGTNTPVVGYVILNLWGSGTYPLLAAIGVVITVVSSVITLTVLRAGERFRLI